LFFGYLEEQMAHKQFFRGTAAREEAEVVS
jgi:hypothetical protein